MNSPASMILNDGKKIEILEKKLTEALKALEAISILGDADWKKYRAKEALNEIERIRK